MISREIKVLSAVAIRHGASGDGSIQTVFGGRLSTVERVGWFEGFGKGETSSRSSTRKMDR